MNYLAHAFLSFDDPEVLVGNMISDFVKGKKRYDFPPGIQAGITLHRVIDAYTDGHVATKAAKSFFQPHYRLYSGAFIDVVFDHFLATDDTAFTPESLLAFSQKVYGLLALYREWWPERFAGMYPYMKTQNWLYHYRTIAGTEQSFGGLARRAAYMNESATAARIFTEHYQPLQECYRQFWNDARPYFSKQYEILRKLGS
jgi:acyl carrier protein phosphodiesterase